MNLSRIESAFRSAIADLDPLHVRPMEDGGWRFNATALPPELQSRATREATAGRPSNVIELREIPR